MVKDQKFRFYKPSRRSWIIIVSAVALLHGFIIGWIFFFDPFVPQEKQRNLQRLVVQTIDLSMAATQNSDVAFTSGPLSPHPIPRNPLKPAHMGKPTQVQKSRDNEPQKSTSNPNESITQPSVTEEKTFSNPLPSNPIHKKSLTPAPLNQSTTPSETIPKKSASSSASEKSSYNPPSSPLAKEKNVKASLPNSTKPSNNKNASKSKIGKNTEIASTGVKKKQELTAAGKQEPDHKEAEQQAEKDRQMKLLAEARVRMSKINGSRESEPSPASFSTPLPTAITSLQIDALSSSEKGASSLNSTEVSYSNELAGHLKRLLRLPEIGDIKIKLTLDRSGKVYKMEVVSSESAANRRYIEKTLPGLSFPAFGTNFESMANYTFAITLSNEL